MSRILFQLHRRGGITLSRLHLILVFLGGQEFIKNNILRTISKTSARVSSNAI